MTSRKATLTEEEISDLEGLLGHQFQDKSLLIQALTHRSFANEQSSAKRDNERLEFLGDAVLELTVATQLFEALPNQEEGRLTACKALMVQENSLARVAKDLQLGSYLMLGRGEASSGGNSKPSLLSDAVEAVIAAIYLDAGYSVASSCVRSWLGAVHPDLGLVLNQSRDPRSTLQELVQAQHGVTPSYFIEERTGPAHDAMFHARVEVPGMPPQRGAGASKKLAKRAAAGAMLAEIEKTPR